MRNSFPAAKKIRIKFKPFDRKVEDLVRRFVIEKLLLSQRENYHLLFEQAETDTRKDIRIKVEDLYTTLVSTMAEGNSCAIDARLEDLSCGGTCVLINEAAELEVGSTVKLNLPCLDKNLLVEGTVLGVC